MMWLLKLYPPRWRRRYGAELADLVATQPFSIGGALDLFGGAVDAWLHPELVPATPEKRGGTPMLAQLRRFECMGYGPDVTERDKTRNLAVNIGGTLILSLVWLTMIWSFKHYALGGQAYLWAAAPMAYLLPYLIGLRYTSLKGRSARAQAIVIATAGAQVLAILMLAGWISTKL